MAKMNANAKMAEVLEKVLSDTYVLAVKTHAYHWNVMGPQFDPLHKFFGEQYEALFEAADVIAERVRALDIKPDGSMGAFLKNASIKETDSRKMDAKSMLKDLLKSHQQLRERLVEAENLADDLDDVATQDLMVERIRDHDKTMWMIRSQM